MQEQTSAPTLGDERVEILSNECVAPQIHVIVLHAPKIASKVQPGQFVHLRIPGFAGHVLRRPFSVYRWGEDKISIMYQVVGKGSKALSLAKPGTHTMAIGPVGHGWNVPQATSRALLVCGGMGIAPQTMLAKQLVEAGVHVDVLVGATTAQRVVGTEVLWEAGAEVHVSTDDGTMGYHGFCTELIPKYAPQTDYVAVCGPEPMERSAIRALNTCTEEGLRPVCEVSLERRMACGIGVCLSCVVDTIDGRKRACVDGPVFNSTEVVW